MNENEMNRTEWRDNRGNTVEENGPLTPSEHEDFLFYSCQFLHFLRQLYFCDAASGRPKI